MTPQELYDWALAHNADHIEIGLQYQDGGGAYSGNTYEDGIDVTATIETAADGEEAFVLLG